MYTYILNIDFLRQILSGIAIFYDMFDFEAHIGPWTKKGKTPLKSDVACPKRVSYCKFWILFRLSMTNNKDSVIP